MISRILSAIRNALAASVRAIGAWGDDLLSIPFQLKQMLYGPDPVGPSAADVADVGQPVSMGPEAQHRAMVERGLLPLDIEPGLDGRDPLGELVKRYAATPPSKRELIVLDKLSPQQLAWLTSLPESDLAKLASANPVHCGRLARGRKTSVVGVDRLRSDHEYVRAHTSAEAADPESVFVQRLRQLARRREAEKASGVAFAA